jgi:hypothetical protein
MQRYNIFGRNAIVVPAFELNIEDKLVLQYLMDKSNIKEII